jgi:hypothetical protein
VGLLVFTGFVALAPTSAADAPVDPAAIGGIAVFLVALLALGPPLVLDALDLARTRYAVTRRGVVVVEGILFVRAKRVKPPFPALALVAGRGGTVQLGEVPVEEVDGGGEEKLFTRLRGLGADAPVVESAIRKVV